jgi:hypothetical protein
MTVPAVTLTEIDGALGVLPPSAGKILAVVGTSSAGAVDTPATFGRVADLVSAFGHGAGVEAAAYHILRTGRPVAFVRSASSVDGTATAVVYAAGGLGTSVASVSVTPVSPVDDYEVVWSAVATGTIGVAGITFRYSLDGGRTMSAVTALGAANTYTIPNSGVVINFAAGTIGAGYSFSFRTTGAKWNGTSLGTALAALGNSAISWEIVEIAGALGSSDVDTLEPIFAGWRAKNRFRLYIAGARIPNIAESEATYLSSLSTAFSAKATVYGAITAGGAEIASGVSGRKYLRQVSVLAGSVEAALSQEQNSASVNLGALPVTIRDDNGNPKHHDEYVSPGLDDARFYTLRTFGDSPQGVYITRPRIFSSDGSDFRLVPHRRVINLAESALAAYFARRLNQPIRVDTATGRILEEEAREIEAGALSAMESVLLDTPKASGVQFTLSRIDNVLSTFTLTGDARVIPLGYAEFINVSVGFTNPALQVTA